VSAIASASQLASEVKSLKSEHYSVESGTKIRSDYSFSNPKFSSKPRNCKASAQVILN
jgi:hypothetical protein